MHADYGLRECDVILFQNTKQITTHHNTHRSKCCLPASGRMQLESWPFADVATSFMIEINRRTVPRLFLKFV